MPGRWTNPGMVQDTMHKILCHPFGLSARPDLGTSSTQQHTIIVRERERDSKRQIGSPTNFAYNVVHSTILEDLCSGALSFLSPHKKLHSHTQRNLCKRAKSTCSSIAPVASTDGVCHTHTGGGHSLGTRLWMCCVIDWCVPSARAQPAVTAASGPVPKNDYSELPSSHF